MKADDIQDITRQIYLYCRAMDRMDQELGRSIWHPDGTADYGEGIFQGTGYGFVAFANESHARMVNHSHQITNIVIELEGDRAASESYVTAALRLTEHGVLKQITVRGRYLDQWSCRDGRWAIDKRTYAHDFDDIRPVEPTPLSARGIRDKTDLSYTVLNLAESL